MDAKDEVKARLSIEDVIGEYVPLKRAGRNWKGLSPFSAERTPSFVVSPDKQIWHDFSSGRGGDVFSFVMEVEGLDFRQALELLARRAGIDLAQYDKGASRGPSGKSKERLYEALEATAHFYQTQFTRSQLALEYVLKKRAFSKATALEWRLGYSPNNGTALVDFLRNKGFTADEIQLAGLSSKSYRGLTDMFRGRLMIPLCDSQGKVIGFTARLLEDDPNAPKYINTPSTPLYDKSRHVFGLHLAKEAIRKTKFVVLAEGNLDVIASHQADVRQVVATAGTALTEPHLKALSRLTSDIRLCFDADKAGIAATERAIPVAAKVGVGLQIITIPSGKDPDELIRQDVKVWQAIIETPLEALDWLIKRYEDQADLTTQNGRESFKNAILESVKRLESSGEQGIYTKKIAAILGYNEAAVRDALDLVKVGRTTYKPISQPVRRPDRADKTHYERRRIEEHLLALTLMQPKLRNYLYPLNADMFSSANTKKVFEFLQAHPDYDGVDKAAVQNFADYAKIVSLVYETLYQDLEPVELAYEAARLQAKLIAQYVRTEKQQLASRMQSAEPEQATALLTRVAELDTLLGTNQGGTTERGSPTT